MLHPRFCIALHAYGCTCVAFAPREELVIMETILSHANHTLAAVWKVGIQAQLMSSLPSTMPCCLGMYQCTIDHIRILGTELELACSQSLCRTIVSPANIFNDILPHEPRLQASSSSMPRIRIWFILQKTFIEIAVYGNDK